MVSGQKWDKSTFTIHNENWNYKHLIEHNDIKYFICQLEKCPKTNKLHWQGYIELKNRKGLKGFKDILTDNTAHIEKAQASAEDNINYCSKSDSKIEGPFSWGNPKKTGQGARSDLSDLKQSLDNNLKISEIANKHFNEFILYHKGIEKYLLLKRPKRNWDMDVIIILGPSGCGKSSYVYKTYDMNDIYELREPNNGSLWWDGYDGQETVLIDEFYGWINYSFMLKLLDRYPLMIDTKGGAVQFTSKRIIIISNCKKIEDFYPSISNQPHRWAAFLRRAKTIKNFYGDISQDCFSNNLDVDTNEL